MDYVFDPSAHPGKAIKDDETIRLRTLQPEEKLAFSYAMAQSSKLYVFESKVTNRIEKSRNLPKELATEGKIKTNKRELTRVMGELFLLQTEINLFSSILDTPDFLWDDDEDFATYISTKKYFEIDKRVELLNNRLKVLTEFVHVLRGQVSEMNSTRLEWIMIWLIGIEILMGIVSSKLISLKHILKGLVFLLIPSSYVFYNNIDSKTPA
jgi:uncharacterized Rmd1/YagE family protein